MDPSTVDQDELDKFSALAREWWNPLGKFRPLHVFNPVRLAFIKQEVCDHFGRDPLSAKAFSDLSCLDVGCGGGLLSEPMARLGAEVVGADPAAANIAVANLHANESNLNIDYRCTSVEELAANGETFDIVLNMEVIEHVANPKHFFRTCADLIHPNGMMIIATLNRTLKSYAFAIIGAEYVLHWLPRGTHDWNKFITLDEMRAMGADATLSLARETGVVYNPLKRSWSLSSDMHVNYMMVFNRPQIDLAPVKHVQA